MREGDSWDDPFARGTRTIRMCSSDARSWDHPSHPQVKRWGRSTSDSWCRCMWISASARIGCGLFHRTREIGPFRKAVQSPLREAWNPEGFQVLPLTLLPRHAMHCAGAWYHGQELPSAAELGTLLVASVSTGISPEQWKPRRLLFFLPFRRRSRPRRLE